MSTKWKPLRATFWIVVYVCHDWCSAALQTILWCTVCSAHLFGFAFADMQAAAEGIQISQVTESHHGSPEQCYRQMGDIWSVATDLYMSWGSPGERRPTSPPRLFVWNKANACIERAGLWIRGKSTVANAKIVLLSFLLLLLMFRKTNRVQVVYNLLRS